MRLTGDYHTHTTFSHGKNTIEENILAAQKMGLKKIVISDHGSGHFLYGVKEHRWVEMRKAIDEMKTKYPEMEILLGIEANITGVNGEIDIKKEKFYSYDIIYVGFHYGIIPNSLKDFFYIYCVNALAKILPAVFINKAKEINTKALINTLERYDIFMVTHPGAKVPIDIDKVAQKAGELGVVLEINASHGYLRKEDVETAMKYNVKFAVNSDAHNVNNIGNVKKGLETIEYANIPIEKIINVEEE